MHKTFTSFLLTLMLLNIAGCSDDKKPEGIAVIDDKQIFSSSTPAKAGEEHLKKVQAVLNKGSADFQALYKGKENTPEGRRALREAKIALAQQLEVEAQAVRQIVHQALEAAVKNWAERDKYAAIIARSLLLHSAPSADVTSKVMLEMNKQSVTFPPLPVVKITPPKAEVKPEPAKPAPKQTAPARGKPQPPRQ